MENEKCKYCEREIPSACRGTRCMEDSKDQNCFDALMRAGGGEYSVNRAEAGRRQSVYEVWLNKIL